MKKLLIVVAVFGASFGIMQLVTAAPDQPQTTNPCPAGSYNINTPEEPVCKSQPTGCPYGDSIPLGPACDKFKPAAEQPQATNTPVPTNTAVENNNSPSCGK